MAITFHVLLTASFFIYQFIMLFMYFCNQLYYVFYFIVYFELSVYFMFNNKFVWEKILLSYFYIFSHVISFQDFWIKIHYW